MNYMEYMVHCSKMWLFCKKLTLEHNISGHRTFSDKALTWGVGQSYSWRCLTTDCDVTHSTSSVHWL